MLYGQTNTIEHTDGQTYQGFIATIPYPEKTAVVRLPTADETTAYQKDYYFVIPGKKLGTLETVDEQLQRSLKLFNDIRLDKGDEFDEYEADEIITNMHFCQFKSVSKEGNEHTVTVGTHFGDVVHVVRTPSVKERITMNNAFDRSSPSPAPSLALYDQISKRVENYIPAFTISDVPAHHKMLVVQVLLLQVANVNPLKIDTNPKN